MSVSKVIGVGSLVFLLTAMVGLMVPGLLFVVKDCTASQNWGDLPKRCQDGVILMSASVGCILAILVVACTFMQPLLCKMCKPSKGHDVKIHKGVEEFKEPWQPYPNKTAPRLPEVPQFIGQKHAPPMLIGPSNFYKGVTLHGHTRSPVASWGPANAATAPVHAVISTTSYEDEFSRMQQKLEESRKLLQPLAQDSTRLHAASTPLMHDGTEGDCVTAQMGMGSAPIIPHGSNKAVAGRMILQNPTITMPTDGTYFDWSSKPSILPLVPRTRYTPEGNEGPLPAVVLQPCDGTKMPEQQAAAPNALTPVDSEGLSSSQLMLKQQFQAHEQRVEKQLLSQEQRMQQQLLAHEERIERQLQGYQQRVEQLLTQK
mmetsp:Transcript_19285/g.41690  ORF Transcript_19285/g.41690 Transcript_19285/m.41690 type:complete len:372 (+) Transcript_19285:223-1338(+)|eukprot:CAMPEP_0202914192 /NCGR_PEP_ID=MMETSP1392-20130828/62492_1 /ASSEMBLY_ACC=CAM_ASM_000868 /TAXON_ID=225041 /ORGANISM="Chlamydomonas chlamydogama, Strain SAG 11-48b" /LENGTH=371 /DNA_ID=CAMNT_0049605747 /DNA_START=182 /DNA_END=1297 /DNA_ORIENTATION=-